MKDYRNDLYDKYHRTPGDTTEGRWLTVLFSIGGVLISIADFLAFASYKNLTFLMIAICVFNTAYTYIELSHLCIRKYWFRNYRRFAVACGMLIYFLLILLITYGVLHVSNGIPLSWSFVYISFFMLPPIIVVVLIAKAVLYIAAN